MLVHNMHLSTTPCILETVIQRSFAWVWNPVSDIKGKTEAKCVWEQGTETIWTIEGWSNGRLEELMGSFGNV
jgi:hypothetical protein